MTKRRYYTPSARITLAPGVKHKRLDLRSDLYVGEAAALEASGLLRSSMLPPPDKAELSWWPDDDERRDGEFIACVPGYMTVTRNQFGGFRVRLTVSREEQEIRKAEDDRRRCEQRARQRRSDEGYEAAYEQLSTEPAFRQSLIRSCDILLSTIERGNWSLTRDEVSTCFVAEQDRPRLRQLAQELMDALRVARIVDTRKAPAAKRGLSLVWSVG